MASMNTVTASATELQPKVEKVPTMPVAMPVSFPTPSPMNLPPGPSSFDLNRRPVRISVQYRDHTATTKIALAAFFDPVSGSLIADDACAKDLGVWIHTPGVPTDSQSYGRRVLTQYASWTSED